MADGAVRNQGFRACVRTRIGEWLVQLFVVGVPADCLLDSVEGVLRVAGLLVDLAAGSVAAALVRACWKRHRSQPITSGFACLVAVDDPRDGGDVAGFGGAQGAAEVAQDRLEPGDAAVGVQL